MLLHKSPFFYQKKDAGFYESLGGCPRIEIFSGMTKSLGERAFSDSLLDLGQ
jgi:hypothetical protein